MGLTVKGTSIPASATVKFNNTNITNLYLNNTKLWSNEVTVTVTTGSSVKVQGYSIGSTSSWTSVTTSYSSSWSITVTYGSVLYLKLQKSSSSSSVYAVASNMSYVSGSSTQSAPVWKLTANGNKSVTLSSGTLAADSFYYCFSNSWSAMNGPGSTKSSTPTSSCTYVGMRFTYRGTGTAPSLSVEYTGNWFKYSYPGNYYPNWNLNSQTKTYSNVESGSDYSFSSNGTYKGSGNSGTTFFTAGVHLSATLTSYEASLSLSGPSYATTGWGGLIIIDPGKPY